MNRTTKSIVKAISGLAKAWSLICIAFAIQYLYGHFSAPPPAIAMGDMIEMSFVPCLALLGLILAWKWMIQGVIISILSLTGFWGIDLLKVNHQPLLAILVLYASPTLLFFSAWIIKYRGREKPSHL